MATVQFLLAVFLLVTVDGSFDKDHKHLQCSKEWIRYLILNACNYSKRHTAVVQYFVEESMKELQHKFNKTLSLVESKQPFHGTSSTTRTTQITSERIKLEGRKKKDENGRSSSSSLLDPFSHDLIREIEQDEEVWIRRARSIKTLVERCCVKLCKEEEFKVLCYV